MKKIKVQNNNVNCTKKGYVPSRECLSCDDCFGIQTFGGERRYIMCKLGIKKDKVIKQEAKK